jgi:hypothetical protein
MKYTALIMSFLTIALAIGRILIPTHLDFSVTSLYKDFAHVILGAMIVIAYEQKSRLLWTYIVLLLALEIVMVSLNPK